MTATAPKTLHIARKLLSVLGKIQITDDAGLVLYEGAARWAWLSRPWRITQHGQEVASIFPISNLKHLESGTDRSAIVPCRVE